MRKGAQRRSLGSSIGQGVGKYHTVDGRNPFRTTQKPHQTIVGWYLQGTHRFRVSLVVQDFGHP